MPEKDRLSWLTPKRRRTTPNLKSNGHAMAAVAEERSSADPRRPSSSPRPSSQPNTRGRNGSVDGNLFYAYARKGNDVEFRFLLTFASASVANEWWLLTQAQFPDCSRPGPQLFSFQNPDFLAKAWRHPAYDHLKSKWMYIGISDRTSDGVGGTAQGITPVQDADWNMLGGTAPSSPDFSTEFKQEAKGIRDEVNKLEERFVTMMEVVQANSERVRRLAEQKEKRHEKGDHDYFELAGHFGRMTDLMNKNTAHLENLSKRQLEQDKRLAALIKDMSWNQNRDRLDMQQWTAHLDRMNETLEQTITANGQGNTSLGSKTAADESLLATRLEKLQQAIEQNSALNTRLLEERSIEDAEARLKFQLDTMPLQEQLEKIRIVAEQQAGHAQALEELIHIGNNNAQEDFKANMGALDRLHDAQNATTEAVYYAGGEIDFTPVAEHLDAIHEEIRSLVEKQQRDLVSLEKTRDYFSVQSPGTGDSKFLLNALSSHLSKIQALTEQNANAIRSMREMSSSVRDQTSISIRETNQLLRELSQTLSQQRHETIPGMTSHEERLERRLEATNSQVRELMAGQRDLVNVMRELAVSLTAQNKEVCGHVVIPPPRKVGRKIVGFVYDEKEDDV